MTLIDAEAEDICVHLIVALEPVCIVWQACLDIFIFVCFLYKVFSPFLKVPLAAVWSDPHPLFPGQCALERILASWQNS